MLDFTKMLVYNGVTELIHARQSYKNILFKTATTTEENIANFLSNVDFFGGKDKNG